MLRENLHGHVEIAELYLAKSATRIKAMKPMWQKCIF